MNRKQPQTPGESLTDMPEEQAEQESFGQQGGQPSDDAAIAAGQQGRAHKIAKPRAPVAPADLGGRADVTRPEKAAINATKQMTTGEAVDLDRQAKLQKAVMTEQGWYVPRNSASMQAERRRNGQAPLIEIE